MRSLSVFFLIGSFLLGASNANASNQENASLDLGKKLTLIEDKYQAGDFRKAIVDLISLINKIEKLNIADRTNLLAKSKALMGLSYYKLGHPITGINMIREAEEISAGALVKEQAPYNEALSILKDANIKNANEAKLKEVEVKITEANEAKLKEEKKAEANNQTQQKESNSLYQIRIIKEGAVLRIRPDDKSTIIKDLPLGAVFAVKEIAEEWIKIILPPNKDGIIVIGYVKASFVELLDSL